MKNLTKILFLCGVIVIMAFSCEKENDEPQLPPATQTGANTFGCYINGELLVPKDGTGIPRAKGLRGGLAEGYDNQDYFFINAGNYLNKDGDHIYIYIPSLAQEGIFTFKQSKGHIGAVVSPNFPHIFCGTYDGVNLGKIYYSFDNSGTINITRLDTTNSIISGTFQLKVQNKDNPDDTIEVTEGRFDINQKTLNP